MIIQAIDTDARTITVKEGETYPITHTVASNVDVRWNGGAVHFCDLKPGLACELAFARGEVSKIYATGK